MTTTIQPQYTITNPGASGVAKIHCKCGGDITLTVDEVRKLYYNTLNIRFANDTPLEDDLNRIKSKPSCWISVDTPEDILRVETAIDAAQKQRIAKILKSALSRLNEKQKPRKKPRILNKGVKHG